MEISNRFLSISYSPSDVLLFLLFSFVLLIKFKGRRKRGREWDNWEGDGME